MRLTELANKGMNGTPIYVGLMEYGRNWALTKEELE